MKPMQILLSLIIAVVAIVGVNSLYIIDEKEQVMVVAFGKVIRTESEPGLHFKMPFYQQIAVFDKRILVTDAKPEEMQTRDKKRLVIDSFTRWRVTDVKKLYESLRSVEAARDRLALIVNSNLRRVIARYDLQTILSGDRSEIFADVLKGSRENALDLGLEVVDVRIKRADLPVENSQGVFKRMRAEREKEAKDARAKGEEESQKIRANAERERTILLAEAERDAEKLRGEGDAGSIKITADAYSKDPEFFNLVRSLEAYKKSLVGQDTLMVLDSDVEFLKVFEGMKK